MLRPLLSLALLAFGQASNVQFKIDFDPARDVQVLDRDAAGQAGIFVKVRFSVSVEGSAPDDPRTQYKLIIEENGHKVHEDDVPRPTPTEDLAVVLAMDTSGSMNERGRMEKARAAAAYFLERLPKKADCGLILFDHEIRTVLAPKTDREPLLKAIREVEPRGGTAFLDAAARGIQMLSTAPPHKHRYLVLATDGVDLNSANSLPGVIKMAKAAKVRILTIGIGEPGKQERVNTVLVLDQSGSMLSPAEDTEKTPKIQALHRAAARFVAIMPTTGWASIMPFSTLVGQPNDFTNDRSYLARRILSLQPRGETALLDATYAAAATLDAANPVGKRAIIAMTDGIDNASRRRVNEVVERAKEAKAVVYTLGFGREGELDRKLLDQLARETGGRSYHAKNERSLLEIFEDLSIQLHDDGIDEIALTRLARETGGEYFPAKDVASLKLTLEKVTETIQKRDYEVAFPSKIQKRDGTNRRVTIKLVRRDGEIASNTASGNFLVTGDVEIGSVGTTYQTRGLVVAEMHPLVYLVLLAGLGMLLAVPSMRKSQN